PLTCFLEIENATIDDDIDNILWDGKMAYADFRVFVPASFENIKLNGKISISAYSIPITRIYFDIQVGEESDTDRPIEVENHRNALASYSKKDLEMVLNLIQGMKTILPELNIFIDFLDIDTVEKWREKLLEKICS